jgi:hypothetical protein
LHAFGHSDHLIQRGGDEAREANHVGFVLYGSVKDLVPGSHYAHVDHLEVVAPEHNGHDVFANVVDVAFHCCNHHHSCRSVIGSCTNDKMQRSPRNRLAVQCGVHMTQGRPQQIEERGSGRKAREAPAFLAPIVHDKGGQTIRMARETIRMRLSCRMFTYTFSFWGELTHMYRSISCKCLAFVGL